MPWNRVLRFTDPLPCEAAVQGSDVEILPTKSGDFQLEITQIGMNQLWMQRFLVSLPQVSTVASNPGRRSIGFLIESSSSPLQHCGLEVLPGDIIVNRFDVAHQRSGADYHYGAMSLPIDELDIAVEAIIGRQFMKRLDQRIIRPNPALMSRLLKLHKAVGQLAHDTPDILELPEVLRALEQQLIHVMVRCLAEGAAVKTSTGGRRHDAIVARFEGFFWRQTSTGRFICPRFAPPSASRSERFALPAKSIWEWDQSAISPCAECTSCGGRSCAPTPPRQPSLAL